MAHMCQKLSFVVLVIFALVHVGSCLKCYTCDEMSLHEPTKPIDNSPDIYRRIREDVKCGDPFINATITLCREGQVCLKAKTPDFGVIAPKVSRSCGLKDQCEQLEATMASLKIVCTTCTTDMCNSATATSVSFIVGASFLFMKLLI